jgi:DNA-binding CsgD family transcriptional regulator/type II secretory pathway predicted ATPase ExeA
MAAVERGGLFVIGEMGVGKSRLLAEVVDALSTTDHDLIRVAGFDAAGSLPLAPLLPVVAEDLATPDPARRILSELYRRTRHGRVVLVVDDAHLLDPASAAVIHQVAHNRLAPLLVAVRAPDPRPAAVDALWRDEHLDRVELPPLTRPATDELVERSFGGNVEPSTRARIWALTRGYPLYLRELLAGALEAGSLEQDQVGTWHLVRDARLPERLEEVVGERLRDLDVHQRAVMEFVSLAPGIRRQAVEELTSAGAIEDLVRRGIVVVQRTVGEQSLEPAHPVFGAVTRGSTTPSQLDQRRRVLGAALADSGESPARAAALLLDAGEPLAPHLLERAIHEARSSVDPYLLERLAAAAADTSGDVGAMVARAEALAMQHRAAESNQQFQAALGMAPSSEHTAIKLRWMMAVHNFDTALASEHFWRDVVDSAPTEDPAVEEMLLRAMLFLDPPKATQVAERCRRLRGRSGVSEQVRARAQMVEATALMWAARGVAALEVLESAPLDALDPLDAQRMNFTRIWGLGWSGRVAEAAEAAQHWMAQADSSDDADVAELASTVGGFVATLTGHIDDAMGLFEASLRLQPVCSDVRAAPVTLCLRAMYLPEMAGVHEATVAEAIRACEGLPETALRLPGAALAVARSRLDRLSGHGDGTGPLLIVREEMDHRPGQLFDVHVLGELLTLGQLEAACEPLQHLGDSCGVIGWWADAAAMVDGADPEGLEALARRTSNLGATGMAARFAALANQVHVSLGDAVGAERTRRLHGHLMGRLPGTRSLVEIPSSPLSEREVEIVDLALAGLTNRRIADELFVAERTVEGHLHRAYRKLGLDGRGELELLEMSPSHLGDPLLPSE